MKRSNKKALDFPKVRIMKEEKPIYTVENPNPNWEELGRRPRLPTWRNKILMLDINEPVG